MSLKRAPESDKKVLPSEAAVGVFAQYDDDGQVVLSVITGSRKDKLVIFNERGRELELIRARLYLLPGRERAGLTTSAARQAELAQVSKAIKAEADGCDVAEIWGFVSDEPRPYSVTELCEMYYGSDELIKHAGLREALIRERIHFKRDKDAFEPRAQGVVEDLRRAEEVKAAKRAARERALAFIESRVADHSLELPEELRDVIRLLEEVAALVAHTDANRQREAREFTHACGERLRLSENTPIEKRAFEVLTRAGFFNQNTNLSFIRHDIPTEFSAGVTREALDFRMPRGLDDYDEDERRFRRDLTGRYTFTIDDISTRDMDDAISIERIDGGYELGIHITDASFGVSPGGELDRESRRRATSIYCADRTVNMLPTELSEGALSLRAGEIRPCISVLVRLGEGFEPLASDVCASFVRVSERYTYDQVDDLLEHGDKTLLLVHEAAAAWEARRIQQGAVRVQKREVVPFYEDGKVRLLEIHEDSPARLLVSEMMVLANSVMADFAARHSIPVLYRGQERPDDEPNQVEAGQEAPEGPAKDFSARVKLKKSALSFEPLRHAGLGLEAYIQATSPIRRYMDLCHQRQFISFLKGGRPWASRDEFESIAAEIEMPLQAANLASRETKRYWLLRYLEQRGRGVPIEGTVVRVDLKTPLVELDEVYVTFLVRLQARPKLGDRLKLKITAIDPHADYIRLSE
jgi:exoribonuclease-2